MKGTFPYKTEPFPHQREALRFTAPRPYAGILMDPGTGKSKVVLDTAAYLYLEGKIKGLLVLAPNGVHYNWILDQVPLHLSDLVPRETFTWVSGKSKNKSFQFSFRDFLAGEGLLIFAVNIEAAITDNGKAAMKTFLKSRPCMMVVDESTDIKSPGAKRTKSVKAIGRLARFRRILSGFPDPDSPIDLYAQLSFLSPHIVGSNVASFKAEYAEYEQKYLRGPQNKPVPILTGYRNLDKLSRIVKEHCFRVTKDVLNLPPKLYSKRYFDLSPQQERMYTELREEWLTEFVEDGAEVSADLTIVRLARLQQIASGYVPTDDPDEQEPIRVISGPQPRLDTLMDVVERHPGKMIIWVRYVMDADLILERLGREAVRYDGKADDEERLEGMERFRRGDARFFVGSPRAGGRGITLVEARTTVYYSHYWGLETRLQSEDRVHRIGLKHSALYVDLLARGTVDERIIEGYPAKEDLGRLVLGDPKREWLK